MTRPLSLFALFLLSACGLGGPAGSVTAGECEGSPYDETTLRSAAPTAEGGEEGTVTIAAAAGVLTLDYQDMVANCCPSPDVDVVAEAGTVAVDLLDVTSKDPCDCVCITDFSVEVPDLDPGAWHVEASFNGELVGEADIEL